MLDAGADVVLAHGPHRMLGVELYDGRPIFYCPGDFVFQPHLIERFPPEFYDENGLDDDATVEDLRAVMTGPDKRLFRDRYPSEIVRRPIALCRW